MPPPRPAKVNCPSLRWLALVLLCSLTLSCTRHEVPFQSNGKLSPTERQKLTEFDPRLANWEPQENAVWIQPGVTQHVCICNNEISSISTTSEVIVFDGDGNVVEVNLIEHNNCRSHSKTLTSISPWRIKLKCPDNDAITYGFKFPSETSRQEFLKRIAEQEAWEAKYRSSKK